MNDIPSLNFSEKVSEPKEMQPKYESAEALEQEKVKEVVIDSD